MRRGQSDRPNRRCEGAYHSIMACLINYSKRVIDIDMPIFISLVRFPIILNDSLYLLLLITYITINKDHPFDGDFKGGYMYVR